MGTGILEGPGDGVGAPELTVVAAVFIGALAALLAGGAVVERLARLPSPRIRFRLPVLLAGALAAAVALGVLAGPGLVSDFGTTQEAPRQGGTGILSTTGSGRAQFWAAAVDAFASDPAKGIGAGGYEAYWNEHGSRQGIAENAHSEPLEQLAELGVVGFGCFAGFFAIVLLGGISRVRGGRGTPEGAALGLVCAGLIGVTIDWTWDIPAVVAPILAAAAILVCGRPRAEPARMAPIGSRAVAIGFVVLGAAAIWAGGTQAVSASRLEMSRDALVRGELVEAASLARTAAVVEPWSSEPWLQLAEVEQAAGNLNASQRDAAAAIERAPNDYEPWLLSYVLQTDMGSPDVGEAYLKRAAILAPRLIGLALSKTRSGM